MTVLQNMMAMKVLNNRNYVTTTNLWQGYIINNVYSYGTREYFRDWKYKLDHTVAYTDISRSQILTGWDPDTEW